MSRRPITARSFIYGKVILKVNVKTAWPIEPLDGCHGEAEIVSMPGTKYKIKGIHEKAAFKAGKNSFTRTIIEIE